MESYLSVLLFAIAVVTVFVLLVVRESRKRRKLLLKKIKRTYGSVPDREYETGDIEKISHYFRRKCTGQFVIDDITWNDLDMDRVYMLVNQTMSSPGEDVLYAMMRFPVFSKEEAERRDALVDFFRTHEEERTQMQLMLASIGKTRLGSLTDTVFALEGAPKVSTKMHWLMCILLLACLFVGLPFNPLAGFLAFFLLSTGNVIYYYTGKDRTIIDAYLECFTRLLCMLKTADQMETVKWPQVQPQMQCIREGKAELKKLRKRAVFLTSQNDSSGDPLQLVLDYVRMIFHVDILTYNSILKLAQGKMGTMMKMLDHMGELDACIAIASFREILPLYCKPEFSDAGSGHIDLKVEDLYHPLITEPVANSIQVQKGTLVTGSNASGKSTFLKNLAINSILAQTLGTCTCAFYRAPFLKVMTSMALRDDLSGGESYFIVEIKSLKRILDESRKQEPLLCIVDEVLRGTNTIERIAASSRILRELDKDWVLPFAATHDIELSYILEGIYENYHFEEEVKEHQVIFNYLLQKGRATSRNAIKLLDMLNYDAELVKAARQAAQEFEETGVWKTIKGETRTCS